MDIIELTDEEAAEFTEGLNITEPGRERLIGEAYRALGLISFFTCGPDEVRAWELHTGEPWMQPETYTVIWHEVL